MNFDKFFVRNLKKLSRFSKFASAMKQRMPRLKCNIKYSNNNFQNIKYTMY